MSSKIFSSIIDTMSTDELFVLNALVHEEFRKRLLNYERAANVVKTSPLLNPSFVPRQHVTITSTAITNTEETKDTSPKRKTDNMKEYRRWYYLKNKSKSGQLLKERDIAEFMELDRVYGS